MNIFEKIILYMHLLGVAALAGGLLMQLAEKSKKINSGVINGSLMMVLTGPLLFWISYTSMESTPINMSVIYTKVAFLVGIVALIFSNPKTNKISTKKYYAVLALVLLNVALALFVH